MGILALLGTGGGAPPVIVTLTYQLQARSGIARAGTTRSDYYRQVFAMTINGVDRSANVWKFSTRIVKNLHEQEDRLSLTIFGFRPSAGQAIVIGSGAIDNRLFGGTIKTVRQRSVKGNVVEIYDVTAGDWSWLLSRKLFSGHYTNITAHQLVLDLAAVYAPGFTVNNVKVTSPVISEISWTNRTFPQVMAQIADRIGWHWYFDPNQDIHFFDSETVIVPVALTQSNMVYDLLDWSENIDQIRTRVYVEGGGGTTTDPVEAGALSIPIDEAGWYDGVGTRWLKIGHMRVSYTGRTITSGAGELTGIPASGPGSISEPILQGTQVNLLTWADDTVAQTLVASLTGTDGVVEHYVTDNSIGYVEMASRAAQELAVFSLPLYGGSYWTTDKQADVGRLVTISIPARGINKSIPITSIEISYVAHERWARKVTLDSAARIALQDVIRAVAVEG